MVLNYPIRPHPLHLSMRYDGSIAIIVAGRMHAFVDMGDGAKAMFKPDHFLIFENDTEEVHHYGVYRHMSDCPLLCKWIKQLGLENPFKETQ